MIVTIMIMMVKMMIVMRMMTRIKSRKCHEAVLFIVVGGGRGATGSTTGRGNHRGAFVKSKIVTSKIMGLVMMLMIVTGYGLHYKSS